MPHNQWELPLFFPLVFPTIKGYFRSHNSHNTVHWQFMALGSITSWFSRQPSPPPSFENCLLLHISGLYVLSSLKHCPFLIFCCDSASENLLSLPPLFIKVPLGLLVAESTTEPPCWFVRTISLEDSFICCGFWRWVASGCCPSFTTWKPSSLV